MLFCLFVVGVAVCLCVVGVAVCLRVVDVTVCLCVVGVAFCLYVVGVTVCVVGVDVYLCGGMSVPRHFDRGSGCGMLDQLVFHIIHSSVTSRSLGKWITEVWNFGQVTPIHSSTVACC